MTSFVIEVHIKHNLIALARTWDHGGSIGVAPTMQSRSKPARYPSAATQSRTHTQEVKQLLPQTHIFRKTLNLDPHKQTIEDTKVATEEVQPLNLLDRQYKNVVVLNTIFRQ